MTREKATMLEAVCWILGGVFVICMVAKFAIEYR